MRLTAWVLRTTWLYRLAGWFARRLLPVLPRSLLYGRWNAWGRQRELPPIPKESFRELYRRHRGQP
jgi:L-lactate dehydrogenase complex protein LldF